MSKLFHTKIFQIALAVFCTLLLAFTFPPYDIWWFAWIGLVPLIVALCRVRARHGFLLAYVSGMVFFSMLYIWIFDVPGYKLFHHLFLAAIIGLYFGLFGLAVSLVAKRKGFLYAIFFTPFLWVAIEWLRSNLSFLALPFPILAHSQYQNLTLIQFVAFTGAYGVSFLIVLVNAALASAFNVLIQNRSRAHRVAENRLKWFQQPNCLMVVFTGVLLALVYTYGVILLNNKPHAEQLRVSVIQGNINRVLKKDPKKNATTIMEKYTHLTEMASEDHPDLIVWPEAATPGFVLKNSFLHNQIVDLIKRIGVNFIIGSSEFPKFSKEPFDLKKYGNTALYFTPKGKVVGQYLKIRLIPFGEYIPYDGIFDWPNFIVHERNGGYEVPGSEYILFELDGTKFGVVICSECAFPDVFRQFVKGGASLMLNITNEGWFGETAAYQKMAASVFRCAENRVAMARATNTGISCFIDPYGQVIGRVQKQGKEVFIEGFLTKALPLSESHTFYTRNGEVFAYLCMAISCLMVAISYMKRKDSRVL